MGESLVDKILRNIKDAADLYHRLILVAAHSGSGKTAALQIVQSQINAPLVNVNLELSRRMLELTQRQRSLQLPKLLGEIANASQSEVVLFDNIEVLFDVALKQDPLRLLQGLARHKTVVAAWNGNADNGNLTYATPEHSEYRKYPQRDLVIVGADATP